MTKTLLPNGREQYWQDADERFCVGDYVTKDGTDIFRVVGLDGPRAEMGDFLCISVTTRVPEDEAWPPVGEAIHEKARRFHPIDHKFH